MKLIPIEVEADREASRGSWPRRIQWEAIWVEMVELLDRWYQKPGDPEWPEADYFKLRGSDGHDYLIKRDLEAGAWYFVRRW